MHSVNLTCHDDRTRLTFKGALDAAAARAAYDAMSKALTRARPLHLYAKDLERLDASGLQLLLAFLQAVKERDLSFQWRAVSPALQAGAELLDLADALELPR